MAFGSLFDFDGDGELSTMESVLGLRGFCWRATALTNKTPPQ